MLVAAGTRHAAPAADRRIDDDRLASPAALGREAGDLVPEDKREPGTGMAAGRDMQIGAAQSDVARNHDDVIPGQHDVLT